MIFSRLYKNSENKTFFFSMAHLAVDCKGFTTTSDLYMQSEKKILRSVAKEEGYTEVKKKDVIKVS